MAINGSISFIADLPCRRDDADDRVSDDARFTMLAIGINHMYPPILSLHGLGIVCVHSMRSELPGYRFTRQMCAPCKEPTKCLS